MKFYCLPRYFLTCIFLLHGYTGIAVEVYENGQYRIQRYTEKDGLITSETTETAVDNNGFLWITSFAGVSRFDGKNFENYGTSNGLTEGNIELCGYDEAGHMLFRSATNIYKYTGNKVKPFFKYPASGKFIKMAIPAHGVNMWVAYDMEKGLELLSPGGVVQKIKTQWPVYKLVKAANNEIYVLDYSGLVSIIKNGHLQPVYKIVPKQPYYNEGMSLFASVDGKVWTYGANNKYAYQHTGHKIIDSIALPPSTNWRFLYVSTTGNLYTFSFDGSSLLKLKRNKWIEMASKNQLHGSLYDVKEINGVVWVNTSGGFFKITEKSYTSTQANTPLVYYSVDEKGRSVIKTDSALFNIPAAVQTFYALQHQIVTSIYVCKNKKDVWFCTEQSVYQLPFGEKLIKLNTTNTYEGNKPLFRFKRVMEDGKGGVWITSYHGIFYAKGKQLNYYYNREGINEYAIYDLAIDSAGTFYASGIHVYAFTGKRFLDISKQLGLNDDITRLTCDANKNVWVCQSNNMARKVTNTGNNQFNGLEVFTAFVNETPLSIASMCFDEQNNLWITDNQSLFCYLSKSKSFTTDPIYFDENFTGSPLLYAGSFNEMQVVLHPYSGKNLRCYNVKSLLHNFSSTQPKIRLTDVKLFKKTYDWVANGFATNDLGVPQNPVLKYNQNFIHFSFAGLTDNFAGSTVSYHYRLLNYDKDWSPVTNTGQAEYTGLPAGKYTFTLQAKISGGNWGNTVAYSFTIKEVWYKTGWAIAGWIVLLLVMVAALFYWRIRVQQRRALLKQMVLEEQLKAIRAQINPHFLQNAFAFLSQDVFTTSNNKKIKTIDKISGYFKKVLSLSDKAVITLEDELEFAQEYLQMQQQILATPFEFAINVAEDVDVFDILVPSMLLQPLIENAVKYGLSNKGNNKITISLQLQNEYLCCKVSDTGSGGAPPLQHTASSGKGHLLTSDRLKLFYREKKRKPQFLSRYTASGGFDAIIMIPVQ